MPPRAISKEAKHLMDALYENFDRTGKWMGINTLRIKMGPAVIDRLFRKYEPALFKQFPTHQNRHCELTFYGFLKCEKAKGDVELLYKLLELARDSYLRDPEKRKISVTEIREAMKLNQDKSDRLRKLVSIFCHRNSFSITAIDWHFDIPEDIERLNNGMSILDYVLMWTKFWYKFELQYYRQNRWEKADKIKIGFWMLVITQAWSAAYIIIVNLLSLSSFWIFTAAFWLTIYSVVNILQLFQVQHHVVSPQKFIEKLIWFVISLFISGLAIYVAQKITH